MRKFICSPTSVYHVTSRCINKEWFVLPLDKVWDIFAANLKFVGVANGLRIFAFVLMNNHFHLLAEAPEANLSKAMAMFISMSSRHMLHDSSRINQIFARRFKRTEIDSYRYYMNSYKYIYQNPLRAGLVERVEDYPFSTLPSLIGATPLWIPVEDEIMIGDPENTIRWLNTVPSDKDCEAVRRALRRTHFRYPADVGRRRKYSENMIL